MCPGFLTLLVTDGRILLVYHEVKFEFPFVLHLFSDQIKAHIPKLLSANSEYPNVHLYCFLLACGQIVISILLTPLHKRKSTPLSLKSVYTYRPSLHSAATFLPISDSQRAEEQREVLCSSSPSPLLPSLSWLASGKGGCRAATSLPCPSASWRAGRKGSCRVAASPPYPLFHPSAAEQVGKAAVWQLPLSPCTSLHLSPGWWEGANLEWGITMHIPGVLQDYFPVNQGILYHKEHSCSTTAQKQEFHGDGRRNAATGRECSSIINFNYSFQ